MNLEQVRAQRTFGVVQALAPEGVPLSDDFLRLARSLPTMLQANGLLATWAHLLAKSRSGKVEYRKVSEALLAHLRARALAPAEGDVLAVFNAWCAGPPSGASGRELRRATAEATAYSVWLKRAAEALLDTGDSVAAAAAVGPPGAGEEPPAGSEPTVEGVER